MGRRIHLIDDDCTAQNLLEAALRKKGFEVTCSSNTYQLFDLLDSPPDIFILDVVIPGLNGLETCKWIKAHNKDIPVIILSGTPGLQVLAENSGADDFLEKPFQFKRLLEKINRSLEAAVKPG